jgi:hypothetical protein
MTTYITSSMAYFVKGSVICTLCDTFGSYVLMKGKVVPGHTVKVCKGSRVTAPFT